MRIKFFHILFGELLQQVQTVQNSQWGVKQQFTHFAVDKHSSTATDCIVLRVHKATDVAKGSTYTTVSQSNKCTILTEYPQQWVLH